MNAEKTGHQISTASSLSLTEGFSALKRAFKACASAVAVEDTSSGVTCSQVNAAGLRGQQQTYLYTQLAKAT